MVGLCTRKWGKSGAHYARSFWLPKQLVPVEGNLGRNDGGVNGGEREKGGRDKDDSYGGGVMGG